MKDVEKCLLEAINGLFKNNDQALGIVNFGKVPKGGEFAHRMQFRWSGIGDMFLLKCSGSPFCESLTQAFFDIHSYKYLNDPTFKLSFDKRLTAIGIPLNERKQACKLIDEIVKELGGEKFEEKEAGWHPDLDEIADDTRNADNRKVRREPPFTGGGPAPAKNELS